MRRCLLALLSVAAVGCEGEIVVRMTTAVYPFGGGIERRIELTARDRDGRPVVNVDNDGLALAEPDRWRVTERAAGRLRAEAFFDDPAEVISPLAHELDRLDVAFPPVRDRSRVAVEHLDLGIADLWRYAEIYGDGFGRDQIDAAVREAAAWIAARLDRELERDFGDRVDRAAARSFVTGELVGLVGDILLPLRSVDTDPAAWEQVQARLAAAGIPTFSPHAESGSSPALDRDPFLQQQWTLFNDWVRAQVAGRLTTDAFEVAPEDLVFWPEDIERTLEESVEGEGCDPSAGAPICRLLLAGFGYYGLADADYRFELRVELPGILLRTNGAPDGGGAAWLFRHDDLVSGDATLRAESLLLNDEALVRLGARGDFDVLERLQLVDLLAGDEAADELRRALLRAIEAGALDALLGEGAPPGATELVELLDPRRPAVDRP